MTRNDVIIVASVSCIYGLGTAEAYSGLSVRLEKGQSYSRDKLLHDLVEIQYERNDVDFHRGTFRARGDTVEIFPAYEEERALRISFYGDEIERIQGDRSAAGQDLRRHRQGRGLPRQPLRHEPRPAPLTRSTGSATSCCTG